MSHPLMCCFVHRDTYCRCLMVISPKPSSLMSNKFLLFSQPGPLNKCCHLVVMTTASTVHCRWRHDIVITGEVLELYDQWQPLAESLWSQCGYYVSGSLFMTLITHNSLSNFLSFNLAKTHKV